eukprot:CAMPEP_0171773214 /NCGR_PEP_ID=MMETSP0991-20121206/55158_1 /TAXON_ID=483369 /ORGANISM="non described non described, Strain CCMP2098" /LENGTH=280 /DNA_ID=CAMNT_0012378905 /DNA_START=72 /DNA_END=914 /DNA_ORIENTATION=+
MTGSFGLTNGEVSAKFQTIITPAGWAFSIWGIIFVGELAFVLAQLSASIRASPLVREGISWGWVSASAFQCAWTFAFAQEQLVISTILIFGIFVSLAFVVFRSAALPPAASYDLVCRLPLTLHFGWLACATALNVNLSIVQKGASPAWQLATGLTSLAVILLLATHLAARDFTGRAIVAGVVAWALLAIADELKSPMNQEQCNDATGGDDCNMISVLFDGTTIVGVARTCVALSTVALGAAVIATASSGAARTGTCDGNNIPDDTQVQMQTTVVRTPLIN